MANGSVFQSSRAYRPSKPSIARKQLGGSYAYNDPSAVAYGKQYAAQRKKAGVNTFGVTGKQWQNRNRGGGYNIGNLGGLLGGRGGMAGFSQEDYERQRKLDSLIWERSTPDVTGVGGTVRWDRDKNMVTSTLSEENQAIYDAMFERQRGFAEDVEAYGGDWRDIQQQRFDQKRALYAGEDAREAAIRKAGQTATGASSTGIFMEESQDAAIKNQRNMLLEEQAFQESQGLIDSSLRRQTGDITSMMNLANIANTMVKMPTPQPVANLQGMSTASTNWSDTQAMDALKKKQGQSQFWNSILSGVSGGMFT